MFFFFFYGYGDHLDLHVLTHSFPTRRSSDLDARSRAAACPRPLCRDGGRRAGLYRRRRHLSGRARAALHRAVRAAAVRAVPRAAPREPLPLSLPSRSARLRAHRLEPRNSRARSEEHTSELQSLMRISYAVFCLKKKKTQRYNLKTDK